MTKSYEKDLVTSLNILDTFLFTKKEYKSLKVTFQTMHIFVFLRPKNCSLDQDSLLSLKITLNIAKEL